MADLNQASFWNTADMRKNPVPAEIKEQSNRILVKESTVNVQEAKVFYREAGDDGDFDMSLLLLHGMSFSSKTWLDLGTIKLMAAVGYRVVAVDLPGFGASPAATISDKGEFLHQLIQELKLKRPVIVSPSMSGTFALPYLLNHWQEMGGYVPVAPIGWDVLEKYQQCKTENPRGVQNLPEPLKQYLQPPIPDLGCIQAPTLVVYGEKDRSRSSALLCLLPFSQPAEIPNGSHPAYLTDPELWHQLLFNFLDYTETYASQKSN